MITYLRRRGNSVKINSTWQQTFFIMANASHTLRNKNKWWRDCSRFEMMTNYMFKMVNVNGIFNEK